MKIELQPFNVPTYVIGKMPPRPRQEGMVEGPKWALTELDEDTLSELCDDFRRAVFARAERPDPRPRVEQYRVERSENDEGDFHILTFADGRELHIFTVHPVIDVEPEKH